MVRRIDAIGAAHQVMVSNAVLLRPDAQVFDAMVEGWRRQRVSRQLATVTIETSSGLVRRFQAHAGEFPSQWTPAHMEDWVSDLAAKGVTHPTVRIYQQTIRMFLNFVCDPRYGWLGECEERFGSYPVQICHEWNTAVHRAGVEARPDRRPFTRVELQSLFDAADDHVAEIRRHSRKGFAAAFRDSVMLNTAYAFGLRVNELINLSVHDFGRNPRAGEFGEFGVCYVRFGKAQAGSPPKRRSVLTVWPWSVDVLEQWTREVWPNCRHQASRSCGRRSIRRAFLSSGCRTRRTGYVRPPGAAKANEPTENERPPAYHLGFQLDERFQVSRTRFQLPECSRQCHR